ncbi:calcium-binding protein [Methylocucumis oryzae]|uniref:Dystroglycan-type cadherin-like domain-containing protein n=1 Tax=Methylocucumis oryzae TaxID=1632867 RepID=A0A0F3IJ59_9GAMM|nr:calcium-binding protein [Methylocucumis oryzae]KJV06800.1 hypothetical protein VZ94_08970 [Methylocucumis oryzae]
MSSLKISVIGATDQIIVSSWFDQEDLSNTLALEFSDGTIWNTATIMALLGTVAGSNQEDRIYGSPGPDNYNGMADNDVIYGNAGNDTLEGGGNIDWDQLRGGRGDDTYVFGYGSGKVKVYENSIASLNATESGYDVIQFKSGVRPQDVTLTAVSTMLVFKIAGSPADTLTIYGQFDYARVEQAKFSDGTVWDLTKAAASPTGTASSELLSGGLYDDVINGWGGRDTINGNNGFDTLDGGDGNDSLNGGSGNNVLLGGAGNDTLSGADSGVDILDGGSGNDVISCSGNDMIVFGHGYGNDTVNRYYEADWTIRFNADVSPEQVQLSMVYTNGHSDTLSAGNAETLRIRLIDSQETIDISLYNPEKPGVVNKLIFANGQIWDAQQIIANLIATPTTGRDILYGSANNDVLNALDSNDLVVGLAGNDSLQGGIGNDSVQGSDGDDTIEGSAGSDYLRGGNGHDVYVFGLGDGTDVIETDDANTGFDTIKFGSGIRPDQVLVLSNAWQYNDFRLVIKTTDHQLTDDQLIINGWNWTTPEFNELKRVEFSDGTIWDITDISNRYWQHSTHGVYISGTDGNDSLPGFASEDRVLGFGGNDYLSGGDNDDELLGAAGNDTLDSGAGFDILNGGLGNDTYLFGRGYGKDLLVDFDRINAGQDKIIFQGSITPDDITVTHDDAHIFITLNATGDQLKIRWQAHAGYRIEAIEFTNSVVWDGNTLAQQAGLVESSAPVQLATLADQIYTEYENIAFTLPNVFTDADAGDVLTYSATLQDGSLLPNWLSFDPVMKSFTGLASEAQLGHLAIQLNVMDSQGHINFDVFDLLIQPKPDSVLNGTAANDTLIAASGNDTLKGFESDDVLIGGKGNDYFIAASGNDLLTGGEGNDTYFFELGFGHDQIEKTTYSPTNADMIEFGASIAETSVRVKLFDDRLRLSLEGSTDIVDIGYTELSTLNLAGIKFFNGTVWDLDTILAKAKDGTEVDDVLIGTRFADVYHGLAGNDNIQGRDGNDKLYGDEGDDWLYGEDGDDKLISGVGADGLNGGTGTDTYVIEANWGEDSISDPANNLAPLDIIEFAPSISASSIQLAKYANTDLVLRLNGTFNTLRISNFFTASNCVKEVRFADGTTWNVAFITNWVSNIDLNVSQTLIGFSYADTLTGFMGNDTLYGLGGDDILYGGQGDDDLDGGVGIDAMLGELGNDHYVVDNIYEFVIENADEGTDLVLSSITFTLPANVEQLTLVGSSALNATGNSLDNVLTGNAGANKLTGGMGNDSYYVSTGDTVVEASSAGTDTVLADISYTLSSNVENLILTGAAALTAVGNTQNNSLTGNSAANTLNGSSGADTLIGLQGNDTYIVDNALDVVKENLNEGSDLIQASVTYTLPAQVENLTLTGSSAINGVGNTLNNVLTGNSGSNILTGSTGDDIYTIASGDTVVEAIGEGIDTVQSTISYTLTNNVEKLILNGTSAINATGNGLDNTLTGNSAANSLAGGLGNDVLTGGSGADHFIFNTALNATTNKDVIMDFNVVDDTIRLENAIMTKLATTGTLAAGRFVANTGAVALDADDYVLYDTSNGNLFFDADGNGVGLKIAVAVLTGIPALTSADFVVI